MKAAVKSLPQERQSRSGRSNITDCRGKCLKRLNFKLYLPEAILDDPALSTRLVTVVICRMCEMRTFCLPNYALTRDSISKIMVIWRNRDIWAKIAYPVKVKEEKEPLQNRVN